MAGTIGMTPSQTNTTSTGMGIVKSGVNAVAGSVGNSIGNEVGYWAGELTGSNKRRSKAQLEQQKKLNALQEQSNIRQADYSQGLNKDYFDYTADYNKAANQVSRLKEAGLNPALMYGMQGAAGSTGASGGGKAEGVSGAQASNEAERLMAETAQQGMGLQAMRMQAEIEVMESQAEKNKADARRAAGSQTDLDEAQKDSLREAIELTKTQKLNEETRISLNKLESESRKLDLYIKRNVADLEIERAEWMLKNTKYTALNAIEDYEQNKIETDIKERTKEDIIESYNLNLYNLAMDILVKNSQIGLNENQAQSVLGMVANGARANEVAIEVAQMTTGQSETNTIISNVSSLMTIIGAAVLTRGIGGGWKNLLKGKKVGGFK